MKYLSGLLMAASHRFLLLLLAIGCGSDSNGPAAAILTGAWGAPEPDPALLVALGIGAELRFPCSSVVTSDPVELGPEGTFDFIGRHYPSTSRLGEPQPRARVQGRLMDNTLTLTVDVGGDGLPPFPYTLERGEDPHLEDLPPRCLL